MKTRSGNLLWKIAGALIIIGAICAIFLSSQDNDGLKAVEETRKLLRQQGFKIELSEFDFTTSPESSARAAVLNAVAPSRSSRSFHDYPNLMMPVGAGSAIVFWKQNWPRTESGEILWPVLRQAMEEEQPQLDAACEAALSGPICFNLNAKDGSAMLLPHLATLRNLAQTFGSRAVLELHDGNKNAAWTNLLAETRLVTAWETEPVDISMVVRFACATFAYNATWQALQADGWSDEKLAHLQTEWETVDFFKNLPETAAFKRACAADMCRQDRRIPPAAGLTLTDFFKEVFHSPRYALSDIKQIWNQFRYRGYGTYADEKALLLFYRDRELELRNAALAPTWSQMRQLPGVTNYVVFQSKYSSRLQAYLNLREISRAAQIQRSGLLARAVNTEARRRILVTAIALERFRGKNGAYPRTLAELAPDFLKTVPLDFMDGQPLRYQTTSDGHFVLYSVGLDCIDNGGAIPVPDIRRMRGGNPGFLDTLSDADIVWPRPASAVEVEAAQHEEKIARAEQADQAEEQAAYEQWSRNARRQAEVEELLAQKPEPIPANLTYQGRPLPEVLGNVNSDGTNKLSLDEMLTLRQVITGDEPETVTFELPINYDVLMNIGDLQLLLDAKPDEEFPAECVAEQQECIRATNGNCLLVWHAIYDPSGQHAVQALLETTINGHHDAGITGAMTSCFTSNLCEFSAASAFFDLETGATLHAKLPELNGNYTIELNTTNGVRIKTITGSTSNGIIKEHWDLIDEHGERFTNDFFNSVFHITLPDSGRSQTLKGP